MPVRNMPVTALSVASTAMLISAVSSAFAGVTDEPHLNIIPRTGAEAARIETVTTPVTDFSEANRFEVNSAGAATVRARRDAHAFSQASGNMPFEDELTFKIGNGFFRKLWVSSPASTLASDGLGPLYNARSCQRCHLKDGRGHPPEAGENSNVSIFLRTSIPAPVGYELPEGMAEIEGYLATLPEPTYGSQLQDLALPGHDPEIRLEITYEEREVQLNGEIVSLRVPTYTPADPAYGAFHPDAMFSPRIAPQMIGLGLLEAIPAADILVNADPDDLDGDGISGRPNIVWSREFDMPMLGRFGLKAGTATVNEQSAGAFAGDIGISNPLFPGGWGECTEAQEHCRNAVHGEEPDNRENLEVDSEGLELVTFYSRNLGVPARRNVDAPEVLRGKQIFYETGCISCHTPAFVTHRLEDQVEQSFQLIWPYSDMLLHDMGEGLADHRPEARATGREWRTPPLWGIGLTRQVSGHTYFLHDGRARSLLEAILWHGGEAQNMRDAVVAMEPDARADLIAFLESL